MNMAEMGLEPVTTRICNWRNQFARQQFRLMSAMGQKQTFSEVCAMSALPPKADIG